MLIVLFLALAAILSDAPTAFVAYRVAFRRGRRYGVRYAARYGPSSDCIQKAYERGLNDAARAIIADAQAQMEAEPAA
jgi:hypothetical protein